MPGAKIPVLEIERLNLTNDGRGLNVYWDETNYFSGSIAGPWVSSNTTTGGGFGATGGSGQIIAAASSMGWARITMMSGNISFDGYIPVFKSQW